LYKLIFAALVVPQIWKLINKVHKLNWVKIN
jgi:hypothetical protein